MKITPILLGLLALSVLRTAPVFAAPATPDNRGEDARADASDVSAHPRHLHDERAGKKAAASKKAFASVNRPRKSLAPASVPGREEVSRTEGKTTGFGEDRPIPAPTALPPSEPVRQRGTGPASIGGPVRTGAGKTTAISGTTVKGTGGTAAINGTTVKRKP